MFEPSECMRNRQNDRSNSRPRNKRWMRSCPIYRLPRRRVSFPSRSQLRSPKENLSWSISRPPIGQSGVVSDSGSYRPAPQPSARYRRLPKTASDDDAKIRVRLDLVFDRTQYRNANYHNTNGDVACISFVFGKEEPSGRASGEVSVQRCERPAASVRPQVPRRGTPHQIGAAGNRSVLGPTACGATLGACADCAITEVGSSASPMSASRTSRSTPRCTAWMPRSH